MLNARLNARQQRFVDEYAIDLNATQSAIRAGYSPKTAKQIGSRLLTHVDIATAVARKQAAAAEQSNLSQRWVLERLERNALDAHAAEDYSASNGAINLIGKHLGMFPDRVIVTDPAKLSDEELTTRRDETLKRLRLA